MELFQSVGNHDIEGVTVVNACYGGTAALLNALAWADSSAWDGRYAIVVAGDIAVYAPGPARPTCGCGAVAMLIGRDAPLEIDLFTRTTHASHQWDFFKPNPHSEYPVVNGKFSQKCYLTAFDSCYSRFIQKLQARNVLNSSTDQPLGSGSIDFMLFHSPYNKLVQKSVQRIFYLDYLSGHLPSASIPELEPWKDTPLDETYTDRGLENALKNLAEELYQTKVAPSCYLSKQVGNTYTAAVYLNLANLVSLYGGTLIGKTVTLFSYGSGAMASMFRIIPREPTTVVTGDDDSNDERKFFTLDKMQEVLRVSERLSRRDEKYTPEEFEAALAAREKSHGAAPFMPTYPVSSVPKGTFYLSQITGDFERHYLRRPLGDETPDTRGPA
jgi:hydroxymethylglutaryl-CoA synthase